MNIHESTFQYLSPSQSQLQRMQSAREAARFYAQKLEYLVPDGPDKTYIMRKLREVAMWVNVAITREADGSPRTDDAMGAPGSSGFAQAQRETR